jgi:hypothetical protein
MEDTENHHHQSRLCTDWAYQVHGSFTVISNDYFCLPYFLIKQQTGEKEHYTITTNWIIDLLGVHKKNKTQQVLGIAFRPRCHKTWTKGMHKEAAEFLQTVINCNAKSPDALGMHVWGHVEVVVHVPKEAGISWGPFYIKELRYLCYLTIPRQSSKAYTGFVELSRESLHEVYETTLRKQPGISNLGPVFHRKTSRSRNDTMTTTPTRARIIDRGIDEPKL